MQSLIHLSEKKRKKNHDLHVKSTVEDVSTWLSGTGGSLNACSKHGWKV